MRSKNIICMLFISMVLAFSLSCVAMASEGTKNASLAIPRDNLPQGFRFVASLPDQDGRVNMTDEIEDFYGKSDIGSVDPANISVGIYQWDEPGLNSYDARITHILLFDEEKADNAISNFKSQYDEQVARGLPILNNVTINEHPSLLIKDLRGDNSIRYLFLWKNDNLVTLVEGNDKMNQSLELAEASEL